MGIFIGEQTAVTTKVTGGGIAVGGGTYVAAEWVTQATEIAALAAACATALYFFVQCLYVIWKWHKECKRPV